MSSVTLAPRPMKICRMNGSHERAASPSGALLVGTVRQPSTTWPSAWMTCSKRSSILRRIVGLRGRKTMPQPYSPAAGSAMRVLLQVSARNACGICISTPAPSPVFTSAPLAPR